MQLMNSRACKIARPFLRLLCLFAALLPAAAALPPLPAKMITSLAQDRQGGLWVGTEDKGIYQLPAGAKKWVNHNATNGVADNDIYALCVDKLGRVWAGTLNHGVSVFNGQSWKNYGVEDGPIGERIFDIECNPLNGDIWMASSAGLARYRMDSSSWAYVTRLNGLPEDQIEAMAFDKKGTLYAGLQCGGIAIARRDDDYAKWKTVAAPWYYDAEQHVPYPTEPFGRGLPSNLINDLLVTKDGTVWAATTCGIAWSRDSGETWTFLRGREYADKILGLFMPPKGFQKPTADVLDQLLPEEYVTCLAETPDGHLLLGFREKGFAVWSGGGPAAGRSADIPVGGNPTDFALRQLTHIKPAKDAPLKDGYIKRILPHENTLLLASYGTGLITLPSPLATPERPGVGGSPASSSVLPHPSPAKPPTEEQLTKLAAVVRTWTNTMPDGFAMDAGDDWTTQGDWCGHYGRRHTFLCAMNPPWTHHKITCDYDYYVEPFIGPMHTKGDMVRSWVHWAVANDNPRVLFSPEIALRRQAECDDHGEVYPRTMNGPDVWVQPKMSDGCNRISIYFYNKDGESRANRARDYLIEIRQKPDARPETIAAKTIKYAASKADGDALAATEVLCRGRVVNFRGGVYKRFIVNGPGTFYVRVARNGSFNTTVNAYFIDKWPEPRTDEGRDEKENFHYAGHRFLPAHLLAETTRMDISDSAARRLLDATRTNCTSEKTMQAWRMADLYAYRGIRAGQSDSTLLEVLNWELSLWDSTDRKQFMNTMMAMWTGLQDRCFIYRSKEMCLYSPNTITQSLAQVEAMQKAGINWRQVLAQQQSQEREKRK